MSAHNFRSRQPKQPETAATSARRRPIAPPAIGNTGPDIHRVPAAGDHRSALVDVGASFFSAVELAALKLPGLPKRREHISRLASRQGWQYRDREGKGGGREFALSALPAEARNEILRRRIVDQAAKANGTADKPRAPMATLASMTHRQAERHSARSVVLDAFDEMRGARSARKTLDTFVAAFNGGAVDVADWVRSEVSHLSRRTLETWLAARTRGEDELLAGRYRGGRRAVFALSQDAADFVIGAHATQPLLGAEELHGLLATNFPQGLPCDDGVTLDIPSVATVTRFLRDWHADPANASHLLAFSDPDRAKSHNRFAAGQADAGIVRLNQRWEIDASPADVLCTDGRRNLYVLVDVATRRTMALVSDTARTEASLLMVARACQEWGVPEVVGTDNGSDFVSRHFRMALRQLGVHHKVAPPYSPERKPFVERAIGSIQHKFMPLMPGYVGANVAQRSAIRARQAFAQRLGTDDADAFAVALSNDELQQRLSAWLANQYAHRPHNGLKGRTPDEVALDLSALTPPRHAEERAIGMLLMPPANGGGVRVVGKKAIRVDGVEYWVDRLIPGQRLHVRLDPADAGKVWLYTDTDPWRFVGIGLNPELAGLDRAELAGRIRAEQAEVEREGRARLRRLVKKADIHSVADRMIGRAPMPIAANTPSTWSTPELDEALRAHDQHGASAAIVDLSMLREVVDDETPDQRFAPREAAPRRGRRRARISPESRDWLASYEGTHEFNGLRLVEDLDPGRA